MTDLATRIADARKKVPRMSRAEFIERYGASPDNKTHYGLELGGRKLFAVPCHCGDESCLGWGMVSEESLGGHFELYYWPDTAAPDLFLAMEAEIAALTAKLEKAERTLKLHEQTMRKSGAA